MITLTRLNSERFVLNCDLIETIEETPDTLITLSNGKKYVVRESPEQIKQEIIEFRRKIHAGDHRMEGEE